MKKAFLPALAVAALAASCTSSTESNTVVNNDTVVAAPSSTTTTVTTTRTIITPLDESAKFVDLRSGKPIAIRKNDMGIYTSDMGELDLYYNPATKDTFYMGEAYRVNGHVMRQGSDYMVDRAWFETTYPTASNAGMNAGGNLPVTGEAEKARMEPDGDLKLKNDDGTIKEKYKQDGEGDDMKYKVKNKETGEKVKVTEDQIKVKDANGNKTVMERDGDVKRK